MVETAEAESVIRVRDLAARFDGRTIFEHVGFDVRRGEVFVILGGSGCGKSTLLKHMIGLYEPAEGSIEILGVRMDGLDGAERTALLRRIGVMWQSGALFGSSTLAENIEVPLEEHTALPAEARTMVARVKLGLGGLGGGGGGRGSGWAWWGLRMRPAGGGGRFRGAGPGGRPPPAQWRSPRRSCSSTSPPRGSTRSPRRVSTR